MHGRCGSYRILAEVARGGSGVVCLAEDERGRRVALKLLSAPLPGGPGGSEGARLRQRFAGEIQALLRVRHPQVVALLDAGEHQGVPFLVLEWVEGETLAARLAREGPLSPRQAAELVARLAAALEHCHAQGVLHRDVKPANVLLRQATGEPLLTDFGLARGLGLELSPGAAPTVEGQALGTPGYWAPEQARGSREEIGPATDVFGLGATLYCALTGGPPHRGSTLLEAAAAAERLPPPPSQRRPGTPAALDAICLRCLAPDPAARWAGPGALSAALGAWLREAGSSAGSSYVPVPRHGRGGLLALVAAGAALLALGLTLGLTVGAPAEHPAAASPAPAPPATASSTPAGPAPSPSPAVVPSPAVAPAQAAPSDPVQALLDEARQLAAAGRRQDALALLDRAVAQDPGRAEALERRAVLRFQAGDKKGGLADLDAAIAAEPGRAMAYCERAAARDSTGDTAGAEADLERALELDPAQATVRCNRAVLRRRRGDLRGARDDLEHVLRRLPEHPRAWFLLGTIHGQASEHQEALRAFQRAIQAQPEWAEPYHERAVVLFALGKLDLALRDLDRAAALAPADATVFFDRGVVRKKLGNLTGATADYTRTVELDPGHKQAWFNRALLRQKQDPAGAESDLTRALALDPSFARAAYCRGTLRWQRGDLDGAREDLALLERLAPQGEETRALRATVAGGRR